MKGAWAYEIMFTERFTPFKEIGGKRKRLLHHSQKQKCHEKGATDCQIGKNQDVLYENAYF